MSLINLGIAENPTHGLHSDVLRVEKGHFVSGPYDAFYGGSGDSDDSVELIETGDKNQDYYDAKYVHSPEVVVDFGVEVAMSPLEIMLAEEAAYEAQVEAEAARMAALLEGWHRDTNHPFFHYERHNGQLRTAVQDYMEIESVTLNIEAMRPKVSGFCRTNRAKHSLDLRRVV